MNRKLIRVNPYVNPKDLVGVKKAPLSTIPPVGLLHQSLAHKDGSDKYGRYNWRMKKVVYSVYLDAAFRHILAMIDGETHARDSKVLHAAHVCACMNIIMDADSLGMLVNDLGTPGRASDVMDEILEELTKRFARHTRHPRRRATRHRA